MRCLGHPDAHAEARGHSEAACRIGAAYLGLGGEGRLGALNEP